MSSTSISNGASAPPQQTYQAPPQATPASNADLGINSSAPAQSTSSSSSSSSSSYQSAPGPGVGQNVDISV